MNKLGVAYEFWIYLKENKKWWLVPFVFFLILLGFFIVLTEGTVLAPFIYTLF